ncbi:NAD(P)/FAD-dependent oxidoreductase [Hoyosella sp. G463]|uniref:NAD(P)/FAD-dependent oxidoreductase n=1 Tax=Lolliginicoccus lacisalsi TaxID=2742202 RepID=A0A927JE86_9ACTN|nr:NAD(P)/FAD-dependent oxidoreductase [Lolliginicoccus lacisalsi]MBD8506757.1 NAD(P)/FAD-dependent oxidoreductase [Lolliginicoccus lacisalsi]
MSTYDVAIVGGGPAGLAAAVTLGRSLRSVIVIDGGEPRNAPAEGAHNVLGQEGIAPHDLLVKGRAEARGYGAVIVDATVARARPSGAGGFTLGLEDGTDISARRVLIATGIVDELPSVPGLRAHWGSRLLHCPYCHGWEARGQAIGVLATGPMAMHQALLFRQLSDSVTVFVHEREAFAADEREQLDALGIAVVPGPVREVGGDGPLRLLLGDGSSWEVDALAVAPRFLARVDVYEQLGGVASEHPMGRFIETDPMGRTEVEGVWAAGNVRDLKAMVTASAGDGVAVAAGLNADLVAEDVRGAVARRRSATVA